MRSFISKYMMKVLFVNINQYIQEELHFHFTHLGVKSGNKVPTKSLPHYHKEDITIWINKDGCNIMDKC